MRTLFIFLWIALGATAVNAQTGESEQVRRTQLDTALVRSTLEQTTDTVASYAEPMQIELGGSYEHLSPLSGVPDTTSFNDWNSLYLEFFKRIGYLQTVYIGGRLQERFGLKDQDIYGGYYYHVKGPLTGNVEAHFSPSHKILPKWWLSATFYYSTRFGAVFFAGANHRQYNTQNTNGGLIGGDYYFDQYRLSYTLFARTLPSALEEDILFNNYLQLTRYYSELSSIALGFSFGRDLLELGPDPTGEQMFRIHGTKALILLGRHWVLPEWAISYEASYQTQGDLYSRLGGRLGIRHSLGGPAKH